MITIRPTLLADAPALPEVERSAGRAFLVLPDLAWIASDDVLSVERHAAAIAEGLSWVAVGADDRPVGFVVAGASETGLHIEELSVGLDHQGHGIGRILLARAVEAARLRGATEVTLTTFTDVAWNRPFYEASGFGICADGDLSERLRMILEREVAHGLPRERRCAMVLKLSPVPASDTKRSADGAPS